MTPVFDRGLLTELWLGGQGVVESPWGFETSDAHEFYSLEFSRSRRAAQAGTVGAQAADEIRLREGRASLEFDTQVAVDTFELKVRQSFVFLCVTDFWAVDIVSRCRFPQDVFTHGEIAGVRVEKDHSYYYHQHPVICAQLIGAGLTAEIKVAEIQAPPSLRLFTYIKSTDTEWIVHSRLLPSESTREVLKWNGRPLFEWFTDPLLRRTALGRLTRYAGEFDRYPGARRFQSFPMAYLPIGTEIKMTVEVVFRRD